MDFCWFYHEFHQYFINFSQKIPYIVINNWLQVYACGWVFTYNFTVIWLGKVIDKFIEFHKIIYVFISSYLVSYMV